MSNKESKKPIKIMTSSSRAQSFFMPSGYTSSEDSSEEDYGYTEPKPSYTTSTVKKETISEKEKQLISKKGEQRRGRGKKMEPFKKNTTSAKLEEENQEEDEYDAFVKDFSVLHTNVAESAPEQPPKEESHLLLLSSYTTTTALIDEKQTTDNRDNSHNSIPQRVETEEMVFVVPSTNVLNWEKLPEGYIVSYTIKLFSQALLQRCTAFSEFLKCLPDIVVVDDGLVPQDMMILRIFMAMWISPSDFPSLLSKYQSLIQLNKLQNYSVSWVQTSAAVSSVQCVNNRLTIAVTKADFLLFLNTFHEFIMVPYRFSYEEKFSAVKEFRTMIQEAENVHVAYYIRQWTPRQVFAFLLRWFTYKTNEDDFDHIPERLLRWIEIDLDFDGNINYIQQQTESMLCENPDVLVNRLDQSVIGSDNFSMIHREIVNEKQFFRRWKQTTFDRLLELVKF
jgi:hypothetical protein